MRAKGRESGGDIVGETERGSERENDRAGDEERWRERAT